MPPYNYCAVDGCKSQKNNRSLSFFSLPVDETRRKRWLEVIGRPDLNNPKTNPKCHFVCCLHFEKYMIMSKPMLKYDAEPTKFLPNQADTYYINIPDHKEAWTQTTDSYYNGLSAIMNEDSSTFPEVPIIQEDMQTTFQTIKAENIEVTIARIKQEFIDNETSDDINKDVQIENAQMSTASKKMQEPRKIKRRRQRKELKESDSKKMRANLTFNLK